MFDPKRPTLKTMIASGRCIGAAWFSLGSAALVELALKSEPDAIVIDMQHGLWDRRELEAVIGMVPSRIPVIVRVAENTALAIGTALDAGAEGVIVPLVESAKEARAAVRHALYPPHGNRSGGGVRPLKDFQSYVAGADGIAVIVMIETEKGLDAAEDIIAVDGIDMVFIGTGDLSLSLGAFPIHRHDHTVACADIHKACRAGYMPCGIFTGRPEFATVARGQGYRLVTIANDIDMVQRSFVEAAKRFRDPPAPAIAPSSGPATASLPAGSGPALENKRKGDA
ncbi:HpcH/HpaI aldolase family protein [Prosthecomicrobium hirschii]|uniref:HpcH/HpaI aldolase family protein n=1 Tax=Prosthecodimorpha hirschii TaxID=665126 RepID=UPI00221F9305|nr:aldolase/citrate lyase family protein [Prosthecomicrobium hirschii]MCW1838843.1 aldolase/citrate lyase family protein [Prosthecomicrobium hirschii]